MPGPVPISAGMAVALEVLLSTADGEVLERTEPSTPLAYLHGSGRLLPGLERALTGRAAGDEFTVELPPQDAYGYRDEALVEVVPRENLPGGEQLAVGDRLESRTGGRIRWARVVGSQDDGVVLDLNHPLADVALRATARVVSVRPATPAEVAAGRVLAGLEA